MHANLRKVLLAATIIGTASPAFANVITDWDEKAVSVVMPMGPGGGICIAPQYVAEELLRAEGFTDIRYVLAEPGAAQASALARGEIDFSTNFSPPLIIAIDAGDPITIVGGQHIGCFELFARKRIHSISDLKGKTVGVQALRAASTCL